MKLLCLFAAAGLAACSAAASEKPLSSHGFAVYDNMFYRGKPDTAEVGLIASNIVYENKIWPHGVNEGLLPPRDAFAALVREHAVNPGPLVLDIERLPLKGAPDTVQQHLETLTALADWARAAAPGKPLGYYGTGT